MTLPLLFILGVVITVVSLVLLYRSLPKRRNFLSDVIPTSAGAALIPIILTAFVLSTMGYLQIDDTGIAYLVYALLAVTVGAADDLWGGTEVRGFGGHLGALKRGSVTTGLVKLLVLGGGAVIFGAILFGISLYALGAAILMAGSVHLANLLDLRPGRASKFLAPPLLILLLLAPFSEVSVVIGIMGGAIGLFYFDLKGRIMLGDAGAAVYGSVLGYLVVISGPGPVWWVAGAVILGLTLLAEVSSISGVIQEVRILRRFDSWGRSGDE
ncbi:glycosyl transferase [soil metagenome]